MTPLFAPNQSSDRAFERLYRAHVHDVYRYALMVLRNPADAEDVAQTTFMKAYGAFQGGERPRYPRRWLITIAHNTCRTRVRDAQRRPQEVELAEQLVAGRRTDSEDVVDARELVRALGALSFNQRAALVMRELEGRSYGEIAEVLETSISAVETLLFRARRALREQLDGALTCGDAERALSLQLDRRLPHAEKSRLRAHLRECPDCASLARRQRARQAALRSVGPLSLPLPGSLASWGGGGAGFGLSAKAAAILAAGVAAAGTGYEAAEAVSTLPDRERPKVTTVADATRARVAVPAPRSLMPRPPAETSTSSLRPEPGSRADPAPDTEATARPARPRVTSAPAAATAPPPRPDGKQPKQPLENLLPQPLPTPLPEVPLDRETLLPDPPPLPVDVPAPPPVPEVLPPPPPLPTTEVLPPPPPLPTTEELPPLVP